MSLNGMMRTGVSGMNAQANRLSTVAENIANSDTAGYKRASTEFSSLILPGSSGSYNSGAVTTDVRYNVNKQGELEFTSSATDLAIEGPGFFIVENGNGDPFLTRAGSFVPNGSGELVNAAGFTLLGYPYDGNGTPQTVVNGFDGLSPVNIGQGNLSATASTEGNFAGNLPSGALPGETVSSSLAVFDNVGNTVLVDLVYTKTQEADPENNVPEIWKMNVRRRDGGGELNVPLPSEPVELVFEAGQLTSTESMQFSLNPLDPTSPIIDMDIGRMTALGYPYDVADAGVNGSAPSKLESVEISSDGIVYGQYENGDLKPLYRLAMANVQSPDKLQPLAGNVYTQGVDSGVIVTGFAESGNFGSVISSALEGSNVDIAEELTSMIESQRSYTANSKVFQTGSDLMEILVNLKR
ncbi:flagellar hook protein FlgE [Rhizobium sp. EC-SD404]|uniref:flagellar hook protein FlgE n=1 Tax=Rhizobium sp. EC-SD404 TaxID=2038389 RepID=UPI00125A63A5|nr:flagellar hook protein FlgE [Rhizobium sp. EC-SD404]VVT32163.1 Flagellar hook protein FlgE [Rhizobium sp. EC-SD404]